MEINKRPDTPGVGVYAAGALLLDGERPARVLRRSPEPIMTPEADFERDGFVPDVVFPTGAVVRDDTLSLYYGAADAFCGVVEVSLAEVLGAMR